jgi:hypothetical protein
MQSQPEYYVAMVPKQYTESDSDLDRQKKLLELGDPDFFGGGGGGSYSNNSFSSSSSRVASASTTPVKVKSAAMLVPNPTSSNASIESQSTDRARKLLELGDVNLFGSGTSPTADLLARRKR